MALTFADIKASVASQVRLDIARTAQNTLVTRWVNEAIQRIHSRYDWPWALDREIVQGVVDDTTGTVSITSGDTAVTGSGTAFTTSQIGSFIQFSASDDWYEIQTVPTSTSLTIEAPFTGSTDLVAGTFVIRKMFYTASLAAEKIINVKHAISPRIVPMVHYRDFDRLRPFTDSDGKALVYVVWGLNATNQVRFTLYPFPDEIYNLELRVKLRAIEDDVSIIPEKWRHVITDASLVNAYEYVAKDPRDNRASRKRRDFESGIESMIAEVEPQSDWMPVLQNRDRAIRTSRGPLLPEDFGRR